MKIGLIADIHADLESLQRALDILDSRNVEHILCAGDLVGRGRQGEDVITLIRERAIPCVQGNHDEMHAEIQALIREVGDSNDPDYHRSLLSDASFDFLRGLPLTLRFEWEGKRVLLAHATPWDQSTHVYPESSRARMKRVIDEGDADIIILGHTHIPMSVQVGSAWIYNPGSVMVGRLDEKRTCAVLTLPGALYEVHDIDTRMRIRYPQVIH